MKALPVVYGPSAIRLGPDLTLRVPIIGSNLRENNNLFLNRKEKK